MALLLLYLKALMFGIAVAAPVGPMNVLCMRRTLAYGWKYGVVTAAGVAASDAVYSAIAALGLTRVSDFLLAHEVAFHLFAAIFLIGFGIKIYFTKAEPEIEGKECRSTISIPYAFSSAMLMTLANPLTVMFFVTSFTVLAPQGGFKPIDCGAVVAGIFMGSCAWLSGVVISVSYFRHVISVRVREMIDRVTGVALVAFGISELVRFF
ncbi:MAG TPA: LysE family transporter [Rickettsiales bacterium]|nr:LysE family transporter [Rickettsiales bacterium]